MPDKSVEQTYKKLTQLEHVLVRPDTYVGSIEPQQSEMYVTVEDAEGNPKMEFKELTFVPGLYKIFDEILVNAADNKQRDSSMKYIDIQWNVEEGWISVENDGKGIPIEIHKEHNIYVPELIFGNLLTSSNYDDDEKKTTGGRNGYGAKLCNIFSTKFVVETVDTKQGKQYKQVWQNNMNKKGKPKIKDIKSKKAKDKTKITFWPDLPRFKLDKLTDDVLCVLRKRAYDLAGTTPRDLHVKLNGKKIKTNDFRSYVKMFINEGVKVEYAKINDRWEIALAKQEDGNFRQISHVNNIWTIKGGKHVDNVATQIANRVVKAIKGKNKGATVKGSQVKNYMFLFVNSIIVNPAFDSQTKETLKTPAKKFGSKCPVPDDFIKKILRKDFGLCDMCLAWARFKQDRALAKHGGKKISNVTGIPKLEDANDAGGKHSRDCTLILTEGDSAKALAIAGLSVVGRNRYGAFPLKGKLLNVRDASFAALSKNVEIQNLMKIIGLKQNKDYSDERNFRNLRYGHIMIMADQDYDGSHIKGLVLNFIHHYWPTLFQKPGFLTEFITPIVVAKKGKKKETFYTVPEYEEWKGDGPNGERKGWSIKYYKGLGTSTTAEAKQYFKALKRNKIDFRYTGERDDNAIKLAFEKKQVQGRKEWLNKFEEGTFLDQNIDTVSYSDFVHKELILFSRADCMRSIPSMVDGLKPGQRKVLFACFKRNLLREVKVAQLAGYISEHAAYHHGEQSLVGTIIKMAQNYVGSNNINLLYPAGQFGTRHQQGKDHASGRYVFTRLENITRKIFHPDDDLVLEWLDDDGKMVEPKHYVPVIPMVLVNGAEGIGTGYSVSIPNYDVLDIIENLRRMIRDEEPMPMTPYYKGWTGSLTRDMGGKSSYQVRGVLKVTDAEKKVVRISEIPVRKSTEKFKIGLEKLMQGTEKTAAEIEDIRAHHTTSRVDFEIQFVANFNLPANAEHNMGFYKKLQLLSSISTSNFTLFDAKGKVQSYANEIAIMKQFYPLRLDFYDKRKKALVEWIKEELLRLSNQARFIKMVVDRELELRNRPKREICEELHRLKFDMFFKPLKKRGSGNKNEDDEDSGKPATLEKQIMVGYKYLLSMPINSLTAERVIEILKQRDNKKEELDTLIATPIKQIWRTDLDEVEDSYKKMRELERKAAEEDEEYSAANQEGNKGGKRKRKGKAAPRKRRKKNEDDSDDEFIVPSKTKKKPKAAARKPKPKPKKKTVLDYLEKKKKPEPPKPKQTEMKKKLKTLTGKFSFLDSDDSDPDDFLNNIMNKYKAPPKKSPAKKSPPKKKSAAKKKPAKKKTGEAVSSAKKKKLVKRKRSLEEDSDEEPLAPPKKKAKRKLLAIQNDESESEEEKEFTMEPPKERPRRARAAAGKPKYTFSSESEESSDEFQAPKKDDRFSDEDEAFCASDEDVLDDSE